MAEVEISGLTNLKIQLEGYSDKLAGKLDQAILDSVTLIKNDAIDLINSTAGIVSAPGEHPSTQTANLVENITIEKEESGYSVGSRSGAPYGLWLEVGTSRMAARPWLLPTLQKNLPEIKSIIENFNTNRGVG